ncbi:hypothetical protein RAA17_21345 [Komagataeibacter rhaeticus]|nr:hypothetical protein [Komagataeibacter rhaeticus]
MPASVMAIGAANLIMHNILPRHGRSVTGARLAGFGVKIGALVCVVFLNANSQSTCSCWVASSSCRPFPR